jgi:hypothetical protein
MIKPTPGVGGLMNPHATVIIALGERDDAIYADTPSIPTAEHRHDWSEHRPQPGTLFIARHPATRTDLL